MKLRYKISGVLLLLIVVALSSLGLVISHSSACQPAPGLAENADVMKAMVRRCYGSPDVLALEDVEKPVATGNKLLIKIKAASVNPLDWHYMRGSPYLMRLLGVGIGRPQNPRLGVDFAGTVEAVGNEVTRFRPGDEVFGGSNGSFAEYVLLGEDSGVVPKPANISFEQAASMPIAAITALQALRDKGQVQPGQKVLINGASGGVGTFAVQIAKSYGAQVTAVCSGRNAAMVKSIGADQVIDYKQHDYTQSGEKYDLIMDMIGNHSLSDNRKVLTDQGKFIIIGGAKGNWLGPMVAPIKAMIYSPFVGQQFFMMIAQMRQQDLATLGELVATGKVTPVIDRRYPLKEVPAAIRYSELGHARGKIIIQVDKT